MYFVCTQKNCSAFRVWSWTTSNVDTTTRYDSNIERKENCPYDVHTFIQESVFVSSNSVKWTGANTGY